MFFFSVKSKVASDDCNLIILRKDTRQRAMMKGSRQRAEQIYRQILDLLEEIALLSAEEGENLGIDQEFFDELVEEGEERGLPGDRVERVFKEVASLARKSREE